MKKERHIPASYSLSYIHEATSFVVYTSEIPNRPGIVGMAFAGKAVKPTWHYIFKSQEQLNKKIEESVKGLEWRKAEVAKARAARYAPHGLQVGQILRSSWGWEQTNVNYYEVVGIRGQKVELCEIAQERNENGVMSGECKPVPGVFIKKPISRMVSMANGKPSVRIHNSSYAYLEEPVKVEGGKPVFRSQYYSYYA